MGLVGVIRDYLYGGDSMAGLPGRIPLPGGLEDDADLEVDPPKRLGGRAAESGERHESPKKARQEPAVESGAVTMDALRTLLAEQSVSLLQAQQLQITTALSAFEEPPARTNGQVGVEGARPGKCGGRVGGSAQRLR